MKKELLDVLAAIKGKNILVIGDMIADVYLEGTISRISREAPVLVLTHPREKVVAGGAANVVHNISAMGATPFAVGVVGEDKSAFAVVDILKESGADTSGIVFDKTRPTISKTRVIAGGGGIVSQQVVRIDRDNTLPLSKELLSELFEKVDMLLSTMDALVFSDYGSSTLTKEITKDIIAACKTRGIVTMADSRYAIGDFFGVDYVKQNEAELEAVMGKKIHTLDDLCTLGRMLLKKLSAKGVLITRGKNGMSLFSEDGSVEHIPVFDKSEVYDVSGAGDTSVAGMILGIAAGKSPLLSAQLANVASGVAVRKRGTAKVSAEEIKAVFARM